MFNYSNGALGSNEHKHTGITKVAVNIRQRHRTLDRFVSLSSEIINGTFTCIWLKDLTSDYVMRETMGAVGMVDRSLGRGGR